MSKGLEALRKLDEMGYLNIPMPKPNVEWTDEDDEALGYAYDIQKELKALEIIKKTFDMKLVIPFPKGGYEFQIMNKGSYVIHTYENISKEDYELLKEVLL